jgi:glucosamine--fructose-6-phosphate aminotransferase (isomerizing)
VNGGGPLVSKNNSSVQEIQARGGKVIGVIREGDEAESLYTDVLTFRPLHDLLNPFLEVVILQLFAYHIALSLGRDIDKPRNLAKSVTVE